MIPEFNNNCSLRQKTVLKFESFRASFMSTKNIDEKKQEHQKEKSIKKKSLSYKATSLRRSMKKMVIEDGEKKSRVRKRLLRFFRFKK